MDFDTCSSSWFFFLNLKKITKILNYHFLATLSISAFLRTRACGSSTVSSSSSSSTVPNIAANKLPPLNEALRRKIKKSQKIFVFEKVTNKSGLEA